MPPADTVNNNHVEQNAAKGNGTSGDHLDALRDSAIPRPPKFEATDLNKIANEAVFRNAVQGLIKQAQEGQPVAFNVDTRVPMTGKDGSAVKGTQASMLYEELQKAYPDNHFTFSKPDLKPGDAGYSEIAAPIIKNDGTHISTKENAMTLSRDLTLGDGTKVPSGSTFAVGTVFDGQSLHSADPKGKVWAVAPDGSYISVAAAGQSAAATAGDISSDPKKMGQVADARTADGLPNHIIVREAKDKDPEGKPLLDAYPSGGPSFEAAYKEGASEGYYAPKAKSADHFKLPANITVEAETEWGHSTAAGTKQDFYMASGFADAKDATAKNYTGETDPRSARELLQARADLGMTEVTQAERGLAKVADVQPALDKVTDEASFRARVQDLAAKAKAGEAVTFDVDARVNLTGADGKATKTSQAAALYDELRKVYPDNHFVFSKPDLKPGDSGYSEIPAPEVTKDGGVRLSSKENQITTAKDITLADGSQLPSGSKFAVGTIYDGSAVKSADPSGKVWAQKTDGTMVQVADAGQSVAIGQDALSSEAKQSGQIAKKGDHIIVRTAGGKDNVDPDGKPLLDAYPNNAEGFLQNYKPGSTTDMWAAKAKSAEHLLLPGNVTVEAETAYGHATASGAKQDYYMTSGFADAKDATAKNYTGVTDPRSASELMRARAEVGLTGETQVEAGLRQSASSVASSEGVWKPGSGQVKPASDGPAVQADAALKGLADTVPRGVLEALQVAPSERTEAQRGEVKKYMTDLGLKPEEQQQIEEEAAKGLGRGVALTAVSVVALSGLAGAIRQHRTGEAVSDTFR